MRSRRARGVVGIGVSAAVWAAVALHPTPLARERARAEWGPSASPLDGRLADALQDVHARLAVAAPRLAPEERRALAEVIVLEADRARLDPLLVLAVIEVESRFDATARSGAGAVGLMQLLEPTLRSEMARHGLEGDPRDPVANVRAGVRYLRRCLDSFRRQDVALMAYNAGPMRILGYLRAGEIPERFHAYPRRVNAVLRRMRSAPPRQPTLAAARVPGPSAAAEPAVQD